MKDASEEVTGVFTIDHARQLIEGSTTKRVKCPFEDHPSKLLEILRRAEWAYGRDYEESEFESQLLTEGDQLKELWGDFYRFKYRWDRTELSARDDIGFFADVEPPHVGRIAERNAMFADAVELIAIGLKAAIDNRDKKDNGRPDNRPGLKAFVREIHAGWVERAPEVKFGDTFEGGIDGDDRVPVSAAAKLVVAAMKILDPDVSGRDCETAMRAIKE